MHIFDFREIENSQLIQLYATDKSLAHLHNEERIESPN